MDNRQLIIARAAVQIKVLLLQTKLRNGRGVPVANKEEHEGKTSDTL